jgi:flagellar hook-length control protein FliK
LATAAELVMAPSAARPETAGARKDAPAAAGETSFAEVLDNEVQAANETGTSDDTNAAATQAVAPSQVQPTPPPVTTSAVELLISLQSGDTTTAQPVTDAVDTTATTPAVAPVVAPVVTPEIVTAEPAPAAPAPATEQQSAKTTALPQAPVETTPAPQAAAPAAAAAVVVAAATKAVQAVTADASEEEPSADGETVVAPSMDGDASADPAAAATPIENAAAVTQASTAPAQAVVVAAAMPAPKPVAPSGSQPEEKSAPKAQSTANRETPIADTQSAAPKPDAYVSNAASASQTAGAAKPQTGAQQVAADATPDIKVDAPAPTSSSTSTSFPDLLAAGRGTADLAKAAPAHPAMQSAPPTVAQVYARFVERFDGRAQRFEISLTPEELGRVDVRIEIGADKKVHAVLAAHDSAALADLVRGQRALERALTDAGIDLKDGGVKFELANDSGRSLAGQQQHRDGLPGEDRNVWRGFSTVDVAIEADAPAATAFYRRAARLDLVA